MKSLIKLIFFALVAGLTFKYLNEKSINVGQKIREGIEFIASKAAEIETATVSDQNPGIDNQNDKTQSSGIWNSASPSYENVNPHVNNYVNGTPEAGNNEETTGQPEDDNFIYDDAEAEEFLIEEKLNAGTERFAELDDYARNTPDYEESSLTSLAAWLSRPASNDLEKARTIFTWIATHVSYDDNGFNTGNYSDTSPEGVLKNRVSVCQGYSDLFTALGKLAGLETETVSGYSKGITYSPGNVFRDTDHAWNAVNISGQWKLLDVTWGAGYGKGVNGKLVSMMQFNDYWFNTIPEEFIFSHLPQDDRWQINEPVISKNQFERLPYASGVFFRMGYNGRQCFQPALNGVIAELPETYSVSGDIKVVSLPYGKSIRAGCIIRVRIKSVNAVKIAYSNNGLITDMIKNGNEFSAVIRTTQGQLSLMANFGGDQMTYDTFLEYEVN